MMGGGCMAAWHAWQRGSGNVAGLDKAGVVRLERLEQHASTAGGDLGSHWECNYQPVTQGAADKLGCVEELGRWPALSCL